MTAERERKREKGATFIAIWICSLLMLSMVPMFMGEAEATTSSNIKCAIGVNWYQGYTSWTHNQGYMYPGTTTDRNYYAFNLNSIGANMTINDFTIYFYLTNTNSRGGNMNVHELPVFTNATYSSTSLGADIAEFPAGSMTNSAWNHVGSNTSMTNYAQQDYLVHSGWVYIAFSVEDTTFGSGAMGMGGDANANACYAVVDYSASPPASFEFTSTPDTTYMDGVPYSYQAEVNETSTWAYEIALNQPVVTFPIATDANPYWEQYVDGGGALTTLVESQRSSGYADLAFSSKLLDSDGHGTLGWSSMEGTDPEYIRVYSNGGWSSAIYPYADTLINYGVNTSYSNSSAQYVAYNNYLSLQAYSLAGITNPITNVEVNLYLNYNQDGLHNVTISAPLLNWKDTPSMGWSGYTGCGGTLTFEGRGDHSFLNGTLYGYGSMVVHLSAMNGYGTRLYQNFTVATISSPTISISTPDNTLFHLTSLTSVLVQIWFNGTAGDYAIDYYQQRYCIVGSTWTSWSTYGMSNQTSPHYHASWTTAKSVDIEIRAVDVMNNSGPASTIHFYTASSWAPTFLYYNNYGGGGLTSHEVSTKYGFMFQFNETCTLTFSSNASFLGTEIHSDHIYVNNSFYPNGASVSPVGSYYVRILANSTGGWGLLWYNYTLTLTPTPPAPPGPVVFSTANNSVFMVYQTATIYWNATGMVDYYMSRASIDNESTWSSWAPLSFNYATMNVTGEVWVRVQVYAVDTFNQSGATSGLWFHFLLPPTLVIISIANVHDIAGTAYSYVIVTNYDALGISVSVTKTLGPSWLTVTGHNVHASSCVAGMYMVIITVYSATTNETATQTYNLQITMPVPAGALTPLWQMIVPFVFLLVIVMLCAITREGMSGTIFLGSLVIGVFLLAWANALGSMTFPALAIATVILALMLFRAYREAT